MRHDLASLLLHALFPVFLVSAGNNGLAMLGNGSLHLAVHFHLSECLFLACLMSNSEDASVIFTVEVALPQRSSVSHKLVLNIHVPVLIFSVEFQVVASVHIVNCQNAIITLHRHVLDCCNCIGHHLLKMVHFVYVLLLVPKTCGLVNEYQVLVFVVDHSGHIIEVGMLEHN